jgi:hypothetical protein
MYVCVCVYVCMCMCVYKDYYQKLKEYNKGYTGVYVYMYVCVCVCKRISIRS